MCVFVKNDGAWLHAHFVTKTSFVYEMIGISLAGLVFNTFNMVDFADKSE